MSPSWTRHRLPTQAGKRIIVTGSNSGIGFGAALELARAGGEITIPARTQAKADDAVRRIRAAVPDARLNTAILDLSSSASVRSFAEGQLADSRPIDTLINNAGIWAPAERKVSVDGFELQFATNVLGHFLLTGLLLPLILRSKAPRVVTVSSPAHRVGGPVPLQDLNSERKYSPNMTYAKTKLANVLLMRELQRRAGRRLLSVACHPGLSRTNLQFRDEPFIMKVATVVFWPIMQTSADGADPTLFAATAPDAKPGGFYGPSRLFGLRGPADEARLARMVLDDAAARQLFDQLEAITGVHYGL
jgi:NAD(P)-dependent dehydrogenase (short-subunit alcohol dehydrogenase family)